LSPIVSYTALLANADDGTLSNILVQAYIDQGDASRAAGGALVDCPGDTSLGDLPPGTCDFDFTVLASNDSAGFGSLVPGPATARFELRQFDPESDEEAVLDTYTVAVTLVAPPVVID